VSSKYVDFETRTSVHITLTRGTHSELRKILIDHKLSMQEVFREFTRSIVERDDYATAMLQRLEKEKRDKIVKKMVATDAESIFRAIENENPLTKS
jgi:ABC-type sugar transport system ATPase subunit|tara:strand:+ start:1509 stop:1796 length:288 start_codon:yes stop_codon:yes gene_type:complete